MDSSEGSAPLDWTVILLNIFLQYSLNTSIPCWREAAKSTQVHRYIGTKVHRYKGTRATRTQFLEAIYKDFSITSPFSKTYMYHTHHWSQRDLTFIDEGKMRGFFRYELIWFVCLFVWGLFSSHLRRHHDRWRAADFDFCSALMAIEQWVTYCDSRYPFIMVISKDPWHSHLLPNV